MAYVKVTKERVIKLKYDEIISRFESLDYILETYEGNEYEFWELVQKGIIVACRMANVKAANDAFISGGGGVNFTYTINVFNDNIWHTQIGKVEIDFKNKKLKVVLDEWRKDEFLKSAYYKGVDYNKEIKLRELNEWKEKYTLVKHEQTERVKALGSDMKRIYSRNEIKRLLTNKKFTMYNKKNDFKGEVTTLSEKDVKDILYDCALVVTNGETVIVDYPYNICKMVSVK